MCDETRGKKKSASMDKFLAVVALYESIPLEAMHRYRVKN